MDIFRNKYTHSGFSQNRSSTSKESSSFKTFVLNLPKDTHPFIQLSYYYTNGYVSVVSPN